MDKDSRQSVDIREQILSESGTNTNDLDEKSEKTQIEEISIEFKENTEEAKAEADTLPDLTANNLYIIANGSASPRRSGESDFSGILNHQEADGYLEQIESLRAKLQFLTQQAVSDARARVLDADPGSPQQELAGKDEKIALLLEEGSRLSQNELKLMTIIKSLRAKLSEDQKQISKSKQTEENTGKTVRSLQEKLKSIEISSKDDSRQKTVLENYRKDLNQARSNIKARDEEILDLQKQLKRNAIASQDTEKIRKDLEAQRKVARDLQEEVADAKLERTLFEDRHKVQIKELESKLERSLQDAKATEFDLRRETQMIENRLENYRTKAEEISSDGKGDVQAKLVRQIETLQSSYSVASENWRGIESSLMARIAAFEKDQVDAQKKEAELRRKLRELAAKYKDMDSQVETTKSQAQELEEVLAREVEKSKQTSSALATTKAELDTVQANLQTTKEIFEARVERAEADKREAIQETLMFRAKAQPHTIKTGFEPSISSSRRYPQSPGLPFSGGLGLSDRSQSRRASAQPSPAFLTSRHDSPMLSQSRKNSVPPTPTINADDDDDFFANTPATPPERTINDMVSTSTAGAGPSVQLVERMSAAVRRLEGEKEAAKEELERLSVQRDEARNQVVGLMQEVELKRDAEVEVSNLGKQVVDLNDKLQTTLEMLGEKSELVEELRADISDMKDIYKATLESTVK